MRPAAGDVEAETAQRKVAVISGGSRGLGRTLVERLLADGWKVATFSRRANEFTSAMTEAHPDDFHWEQADLGEPEAMRAFARSVGRRFGRADLLVNNAGMLHQELLLTTPSKRIDSLITNNLTAPILLTQACARLMTRHGGNIINISSINAIRGFRGVSVYAAAKAGLEGFSRSLARELGTFNIRVNSIVPGFFDSDMTANVTDRNRERIQHRTPLGRLGTADEIADAILFLTSARAHFVTGQSIVIDGGITC
ncbi:SDR family NAD(P)-dependent oxidoreductase [Streptomyces sp. WELS2]|uniref:SDR family NAD(P)-dependent oxidoreductase n=1 Tax=Streptomyces sp. WELS2 TaxID=2749435 RepID=UPI0015EFF5F5|nr:SDR family oxidoreductase [Streptomyces sp. WELS2]